MKRMDWLHVSFGWQDRLQGPLPPKLRGPNYSARIAGFPKMDAEGLAAFG